MFPRVDMDVHPKVQYSVQYSTKCTKDSKVTSRTLQASLSMLNVKSHGSTIRRRLDKYNLLGRVAMKKPLPPKSTTEVCKTVSEQQLL